MPDREQRILPTNVISLDERRRGRSERTRSVGIYLFYNRFTDPRIVRERVLYGRKPLIGINSTDPDKAG